jgi:hypothetical protein
MSLSSSGAWEGSMSRWIPTGFGPERPAVNSTASLGEGDRRGDAPPVVHPALHLRVRRVALRPDQEVDLEATRVGVGDQACEGLAARRRRGEGGARLLVPDVEEEPGHPLRAREVEELGRVRGVVGEVHVVIPYPEALDVAGRTGLDHAGVRAAIAVVAVAVVALLGALNNAVAADGLDGAGAGAAVAVEAVAVLALLVALDHAVAAEGPDDAEVEQAVVGDGTGDRRAGHLRAENGVGSACALRDAGADAFRVDVSAQRALDAAILIGGARVARQVDAGHIDTLRANIGDVDALLGLRAVLHPHIAHDHKAPARGARRLEVVRRRRGRLMGSLDRDHRRSLRCVGPVAGAGASEQRGAAEDAQEIQRGVLHGHWLLFASGLRG